jgi:hypothetical protein
MKVQECKMHKWGRENSVLFLNFNIKNLSPNCIIY